MLAPHAPLRRDPSALGRLLSKWMLGTALLLAAFSHGAEAAVAAHEIHSLPGWDHALPSRQYSGFINAEAGAPTPGHERRLHYVLVLAENNPEFIEWPGHQNAAPLPRRDSAPL